MTKALGEDGGEVPPTDDDSWAFGRRLADEISQIIGRFVQTRLNVAAQQVVDHGGDPTPIYAAFAEILRACADAVETKAATLLEDSDLLDEEGEA